MNSTERLRRQLEKNAEIAKEQLAVLAAARAEPDPEAARERLDRRDRESAERLADEYGKTGQL